MVTFQRITTEYVEAEDRVRLTGEVEAADTVVLWLTRRLLDRLVPHLTQWLERQHGDVPCPDLQLTFAQQAAQSDVTPQVPVAAWSASPQWLVQAIDLQPGDEQMQLVFKGGDGQAAGIGFASTQLRQWLGIVHRAYLAAQWPCETVWPEWLESARDEALAPVRMVLH